MRRRLILAVLVLIAASTAAQWYHSEEIPATTPVLSPTVTATPLIQAKSGWNREVPVALPTPPDSYLAGVAPFLAHQFETPEAEEEITQATPRPTNTPEPARTAKVGVAATPYADRPHPVIEGLQELSVAPSTGDQGSRLYGVVKTSKDPVPAAPPPATPTIAPTATSSAEYPRVYGQAGGYTMLYLMHPRARQTVEGEIRTMLRANLDTMYVGALVDGTFNLDFPYLETVVRRLNGQDRKLILVLYFSSGPTMRRFDTTPITTPFSQIEPEYFRYLIGADQGIRNEFIEIVSRANPIFDLNKSLNAANTNIATVMLEDNLDAESYRVMREVAQGVLAGRAEMMRNPCPRCYAGNDSEPLGDALETHEPSTLATIRSGDGFSLDGTGFSSPTDDLGGQPSIEAIKIMKDTAISRGARFFGLWRQERQGLGGTSQLTHPDDRNYEVMTPAQELAEIDLLRHGLSLTAPIQ